MLKKLLLTTLLLFVFTIQGALAENLNTRFAISNAVKFGPNNAEETKCYILTDNITGQKYIVLDNTHWGGNCGYGGIAITPLLKPAVYVHKK